jgi:ankyrin repeat protein
LVYKNNKMNIFNRTKKHLKTKIVDWNPIIEQRRLLKKHTHSLSFEDAVRAGHVKAIKFFLKKGINPNKLVLDYSNVKRYPLELAVLNGNYKLAELLIKSGAHSNVFTADDEKLPLLSIAIMDKNISIIKLMLKSGANPNASGVSGQTSFQFAKNSPEILKVLYNPMMQQSIDASTSISYQFEPGDSQLSIANN